MHPCTKALLLICLSPALKLCAVLLPFTCLCGTPGVGNQPRMMERMRKLKIDDWITTARRRKWKWAHKLATAGNNTWTTKALRCEPTVDEQLNARRRTGRPKTRWCDDIRKYVQQQQQHNHNTNNSTNNHQHLDNLMDDPTRHNNDCDDNSTTDNNNGQPNNMDAWLDVAKDTQCWATLEELFATRDSLTPMG